VDRFVHREIREDLEDGAEILWQKHANVTVRKIRSRIKRKEQLTVFDDSDVESPRQPTALRRGPAGRSRVGGAAR
jgi:hypothetical protein